MGIEIAAEPGVERTSTVTIECDERKSMLCQGSIRHTGLYTDARRRATAAGWLERFSSDRGRIFICAECRAP